MARRLVAVPMPLLIGLARLMQWRAVAKGRDGAPFVWALAIFALSMAGLAVSMWPDVVPGRVTIRQAAAPLTSQMFMLVGTAVLVPMILAYTDGRTGCFAGRSTAIMRTTIRPA